MSQIPKQVQDQIDGHMKNLKDRFSALNPQMTEKEVDFELQNTHFGLIKGAEYYDKHINTINHYQDEVSEWMKKCFPQEIIDNKIERAMRFFEEATELCQSIGMTRNQAERLLHYTYGRPIGEPAQEVGGVMITLASLCGTCNIKMQDEGYKELERINDPEIMNKIQNKQVTKKTMGITPDML